MAGGVQIQFPGAVPSAAVDQAVDEYLDTHPVSADAIEASVDDYLLQHPPQASPMADANTPGVVRLTGELGGTADNPILAEPPVDLVLLFNTAIQ